MYLEWNQLSPNQQQAMLWHGNGVGGYPSEGVADVEREYNAFRARQAEIKRLEADAAMTEAVAKQDEEKGRRLGEYQASSEQRATTGNRGMISGGTGFAKLRRKVLGSVGGLGSTDEKLGG